MFYIFSGKKSLQADMHERGLDPEKTTIVAIYEDSKSLVGREVCVFLFNPFSACPSVINGQN
jgi:hypothetical protein